MAVTVTLRPSIRFQSDIGLNENGTLITKDQNADWDQDYNIEGTNDPIEARLELLYQTDAIYDGLVRKSYTVEYQGPNFFIGTLTYGVRSKQIGRLEYQYQIGGKTEKRLQSLATTAYPATAPDYKGAIGVTKSGDSIDVQGVDVYVPSKTFSLKWTLDAADITPTLEQNLYAMTIAPVNSVSFLGYAAGEVVFLGAEGGLKENEPTGELTLKFEASPNLTGLTVGEITGITKGGWQLVDIVRETTDDTGAGTKFLRPKILGVYVHTVYNSSNFAGLLGFSTLP